MWLYGVVLPWELSQAPRKGAQTHSGASSLLICPLCCHWNDLPKTPTDPQVRLLPRPAFRAAHSTPLSFPAETPTLPSWMKRTPVLHFPHLILPTNFCSRCSQHPHVIREDKKLERSLSYCGAQDSNLVFLTSNLLLLQPLCLLPWGPPSLPGGTGRLHIVGLSLGHTRPAWAWWGEEGKASGALTELGFGSCLSSRFGCSWSPCS